MATHVPALIVGAGISGLVCAHALQKTGVNVLVAEASERTGGLIRSERRDGYLVELGPQSFSSTAPLRELCRELGIAEQLVAAPPRAPRYLLIDGRLRAVPLSPPAFFCSSLFSVTTKWALLRDAFGHSAAPSGDESIAAFTRRKFGEELLDKLVGPFVSGIYAGDAERLSLRAAFPPLYEAERSHGSVIRGMMRAGKAARARADSHGAAKERATLQTFREGNETLVRVLAQRLGARLRTEAAVVALGRDRMAGSATGPFVARLQGDAGEESIVADHVVLAAPPNVTARLMASVGESTGEPIDTGIEEIEFAPVAVVSLGYARSGVGHRLDGFGFLIPRSQKIRTLGTVFNSSLFPGRAPEGYVLLTSFLGGASDPLVTALPAEQIVAIVHRELASILSIAKEPAFSNVQLYDRALPQYNLGHLARLDRLRNALAVLPGLHVTGNYLRGPAIGTCIEHALATADAVRAGLDPKPR